MLKNLGQLPHTTVEDKTINPEWAVTRATAWWILVEEGNDEERISLAAEAPLIRSNTTETSTAETSNTERTAECPLNLTEVYVSHDVEFLNSIKALATPVVNPPTARDNN